MIDQDNLYNVYFKLRQFLPSINPMFIRSYNKEYILAYIIYNEDDINTLKIYYDAETKSFCTSVSNFKKGYDMTIIGDPFESVEKLFIEYNKLDGISIPELNYAVSHIILPANDFTDTHIRYNIRDYIINIDIIDNGNEFELTLSNDDYKSKSYRFISGYDVFNFIQFMLQYYIKMYFDKQNDMMLDLIMDLYTQFGYRKVFIMPNTDGKSNVSIRLITPYGDMYFTYNDGKILCEYYHELDGKRTYYDKTVDTCKEALDWAYC